MEQGQLVCELLRHIRRGREWIRDRARRPREGCFWESTEFEQIPSVVDIAIRV